MFAERREFLKLATMAAFSGPTALSAAVLQQKLETKAKPSFETRDTPLFTNADEVEWQKIAPMQPESDAVRMATLHIDPVTKATQLMIRVPAGYYVPQHWHSANETHTVLRGTATFECDGRRKTQGPGGFNYLPAKSVHRAWMSPGVECVLFITMDQAWDVNFVEDNDPRVPAWMKQLQGKTPPPGL